MTRQAGDNGGFYCTIIEQIMEQLRDGFQYTSLNTESPNVTPFWPQTHRFRDTGILNPPYLLLLFHLGVFLPLTLRYLRPIGSIA